MLVRICSRFVDLWFQNPQVKVHPVHQFRSWLIELFQVGVPGWRSRLAFQVGVPESVWVATEWRCRRAWPPEPPADAVWHGRAGIGPEQVPNGRP